MIAVEFFDVEHLRIYNAGLTLLIVGLLSFRVTSTWVGPALETRLEANVRRVRSVLITLVFALASYASVSAYIYGFPIAPHVPVMTVTYLLVAVSLLPSRLFRFILKHLPRKNTHV